MKKKKKPTKTVFIRMLFTYFNNLSMIHSWTILPGSAFLEGDKTTSSTMKWEYFGLCLTAKRQVGQVSELCPVLCYVIHKNTFLCICKKFKTAWLKSKNKTSNWKGWKAANLMSYVFFTFFLIPLAVARQLITMLDNFSLTYGPSETTQLLDILAEWSRLSRLHVLLRYISILFRRTNGLLHLRLLLWTWAAAICRPQRTSPVGHRQRVAVVVPTSVCGTTCCHAPCAVCLLTFC